jgi:multidrug efflux system membrane fusion protein
VQLEALGTVTPLANVIVQPQVSGVLTAVLFQEGQMVKKGDVLATIDPQPFQNALGQASGARQRDEAQLAAARVTLQRYQTLLGQDSIARQDVDTQAALVKQLEGTVAIDRANENTAKLNLAWSRITAPVSGRIGLRPVDGGNYISTGTTNGIATITQIAPIDVEFAIPQDRVPEVQERLAQGAKLDAPACERSLLHARQPGRHRHRHRQGQGPLRQRRQRAVPEPVRQSAAAAAHRGQRGGGAGHGVAPRPQRRLRVCAERRQHGVAAAGDAR